MSVNIHRRHLTTKQRAAIAAELANMTLADATKKGNAKQYCSPGSNDPGEKISNEQAAEMMNP